MVTRPSLAMNHRHVSSGPAHSTLVPQAFRGIINYILNDSPSSQSAPSSEVAEIQTKLPPKSIWTSHRQPELSSDAQISVAVPFSGTIYIKIINHLRTLSASSSRPIFSKYPFNNLIQGLDTEFQKTEAQNRPQFLDKLSKVHPELHRAFLESLVTRSGMAGTNGLPDAILALGRDAVIPSFSATQKIIQTQQLVKNLETNYPDQYKFIKSVALLCHEQWTASRTDQRIVELSKALSQWFGRDMAIMLIRSAPQIFKSPIPPLADLDLHSPQPSSAQVTPESLRVGQSDESARLLLTENNLAFAASKQLEKGLFRSPSLSNFGATEPESTVKRRNSDPGTHTPLALVLAKFPYKQGPEDMAEVHPAQPDVVGTEYNPQQQAADSFATPPHQAQPNTEIKLPRQAFFPCTNRLQPLHNNKSLSGNLIRVSYPLMKKLPPWNRAIAK